MNATIQYSLLRILIFLASMLLLWLVGFRNPFGLVLLAATISMLISFFLLAGLRNRMSADLAERVDRRRGSGASRDNRVEDAGSAGGVGDAGLDSGSTGGGSHPAPVQDPDGFR